MAMSYSQLQNLDAVFDQKNFWKKIEGWPDDKKVDFFTRMNLIAQQADERVLKFGDVEEVFSKFGWNQALKRLRMRFRGDDDDEEFTSFQDRLKQYRAQYME